MKRSGSAAQIPEGVLGIAEIHSAQGGKHADHGTVGCEQTVFETQLETCSAFGAQDEIHGFADGQSGQLQLLDGDVPGRFVPHLHLCLLRAQRNGRGDIVGPMISHHQSEAIGVHAVEFDTHHTGSEATHLAGIGTAGVIGQISILGVQLQRDFPALCINRTQWQRSRPVGRRCRPDNYQPERLTGHD